MHLLTLRVPATSANLGSGFDCFGMALDLWNTFELHLAPGQGLPVVVENYGEGAASLPRDHTNVAARILIDELEETFGMTLSEPVRLVCHSGIPCGSGLGSSSTAVIAGLACAHLLARRDLRGDAETLKRSVLRRAVEIEGHGDNVAPALLGGLVVVAQSRGRLVTRRVELPPLKVVVCVPEFAFLTTHARAVLPPTLPRADAIFNIGHAVLTVEALRTGDLKLLAQAVDDRLHEPYRLPTIPGALAACDAARDAGANAVCLSGAGPGLLAFAADHHHAIGEAMQAAFEREGLRARTWALPVLANGVEAQFPA